MTRRIALHSVAAVAMLLLVGSALLSCTGGKSGSGGGTGFPIPDYAALEPDKLNLKECNLELAGSKYKAELKQTREGDDILIEVIALNTVFESERYRSTKESFSFVDLGGEACIPPIPLAKYPMSIGDSWAWEGETKTGPVSHRATAKIQSYSEDLTIEGGIVHNVVRIEVALEFESGVQDSPASRKLTFWIAPHAGVVKRSYGDYSTREPLEK